MTSLYCEICGEEVREDMIGRGVNRVQERGLNTLLTAGAEKGITYSLHVGDLVHDNCRKMATCKLYLTAKHASPPQYPRRVGFCYRTCCLFCEKTLAKLVPNEKVRLVFFNSNLILAPLLYCGLNYL